jgi:hypothetical protein
MVDYSGWMLLDGLDELGGHAPTCIKASELKPVDRRTPGDLVPLT